MKKIIVLLFLLIVGKVSFGQNLDDLDSYTVDTFYEKVDLDYGTLGEDGHYISYIFVKKEIDAGEYKIELTDAVNDLYEIKGTNLYIKFTGYFGYAGYSTECILKVGSYSATVYKLE